MKKLEDLTSDEFIKLRSSGLLNVIYPDTPPYYEHNIKFDKPLIKSIKDIDFLKLQVILENYMSDIYRGTAYINDDTPHYIYEECMQSFYGSDIFDKIREMNKLNGKSR